MISYQDSQSLLKKAAADHCQTRQTEIVSLERCVGRVMAEDIHARECNPPFNNSAMDGVALRLNQIQNVDNLTEQWFELGGLIGAGDSNGAINPDAVAVEIMTGAPIPSADFNAVIKVEEVEIVESADGKRVRLTKIPVLGENIRRAGEDTRINDTLIIAGTVLNENHLLILATQGVDRVRVKAKLKCAIISTGKELVAHSAPSLAPGQIRNSTGIFLQTVLETPLSETINFGIVEDKKESFLAVLDKAFKADADIVVSTGAVSMGVFDFVKPALEELGAEIHFHKCAIRPGKPILFASLKYQGRTRFIFGVPGNPVSTVVGYNFFIKPFVKFLFQLEPVKPLIAKLSNSVQKPEGLQCFFKAKLSFEGPDLRVESLKGQASFMVSPFLHSNAWVVLPEDKKVFQQNEEVEVFQL